MFGFNRKRKEIKSSAAVETKSDDTCSSLSNPSPWLLELFGSTPVLSGVSVGPSEAMRCTAVRCATNAIAETIGQLPVRSYVKAPDGSAERDASHPVETLLDDAVSDFMAGGDFREQLTRDCLLHDVGGLAFINRVEGRPIELNRLDPSAVSATPDAITGELVYRVNGTIVPAANIFHLKNPLVGLLPQCARTQAREAIGLAIVLEQHAARLFGNGARPSGVLSIKGATDVALQKAKASWQAAHSGNSSGSTAVIPAEAQWTPMTLTSVDAQFHEMRNFAIVEIARAWRTPPVILMEYGRATWSNSEEMGGQFVTYTLMPWIKRWESEIRLKLFTPDERKIYKAEFLTDDLLRADLAQRAAAYAQLVTSRVLNPNEIRAMENRAPYKGGDEFLNPNTTPAAAPPAKQETPANV